MGDTGELLMTESYKTRKEQVEDFIKRAKLPLTRTEKARFRQAMKDACMVGACEERSHCLNILRKYGLTGAASVICLTSVLKVLGYEE